MSSAEFDYEAIVIGGGSAGLSAAVTLLRAQRTVLVIDAGHPRNAPAMGAHYILGQDGVNPLKLLETAREEVEGYGGKIIHTGVKEVTKLDEGFRVTAQNGAIYTVRGLIVATGVKDMLPDIPGLDAQWGKGVVHCPYCHGWEIRNTKLGVLGVTPHAVMQAILFSQWSKDILFFTQGNEYSEEDLGKLAALDIPVYTSPVVSIQQNTEGALSAVTLEDGTAIELDTVVVGAPVEPKLEGLDGLGLALEDSMAGPVVAVEAQQATSVPGVWAGGNVINPSMQVMESAASGVRAAAGLNMNFIFADLADAQNQDG